VVCHEHSENSRYLKLENSENERINITSVLLCWAYIAVCNTNALHQQRKPVWDYIIWPSCVRGGERFLSLDFLQISFVITFNGFLEDTACPSLMCFQALVFLFPKTTRTPKLQSSPTTNRHFWHWKKVINTSTNHPHLIKLETLLFSGYMYKLNLMPWLGLGILQCTTVFVTYALVQIRNG